MSSRDSVTIPVLTPAQILARLESLTALQLATGGSAAPAITAPPAVMVNGAGTVAQFGAIIPRSARVSTNPFSY